MKLLLTRIGLAAAISLVALLLVSCGSDKDTSQKLSQRSIVEQAPPLDEVLVTEAQIQQEPADSVRRQFLGYWQLLQYQAFSDALELYEPALVRTLGAEQIVEALKGQAPYFRSVRPRITGVKSRKDADTVLYEVKDLNGAVTPRSVSWRRSRGTWLIHYDAFLDGAMRDQIQSATQVAIDPHANTASRRAIQAGHNAGRLQSTYIAKVAPTRSGGNSDKAEPRATDDAAAESDQSSEP